MADNTGDRFLELYDIIRTLRGPDGCPWDREQTPETLKGSLIEEVYEAIEAVDSNSPLDIAEELGDLYLLVTSLAIMYEESGSFTVSDSLRSIAEKLVRRHPHVFGDAQADTPDEVLDQWNRIKVEQEGRRKKDRYLDAVSRALPPLERSFKLQKKAAKVGFDWPDTEGVVSKLREEIAEVETELARGSASHSSEAVEAEIGDLIFSAVNVARYLGVDPSAALHKTNEKFMTRFAVVETTLESQGTTLTEATLEQMDAIWNTQRDSNRRVSD